MQLNVVKCNMLMRRIRLNVSKLTWQQYRHGSLILSWPQLLVNILVISKQINTITSRRFFDNHNQEKHISLSHYSNNFFQVIIKLDEANNLYYPT